MPTARDRLRDLFAARAVSFGRFTLASGKESTYYINSKQALFHGEALAQLADCLYDATTDLEFHAVGGLEVGAIPMAAAAVLRFQQAGRTLEGFFVRKAAKGHGSMDLVEGGLKAGDRAVVLDDVLTTGDSALKAVHAVEAAGASVVRIVCIVDRLQGAADKLAGYDFRPLFTVRDFGIEPLA